MGELSETCIRCRRKKPITEIRKTPKGHFLCNACVEEMIATRATQQKPKDAEYEGAVKETLRAVAYPLDVICFCLAPAWLFWLIIDHIAFFRSYSDGAALCVLGVLFGVVCLFWRRNKKPAIPPSDEEKT